MPLFGKPLPVGSPVELHGRVKECIGLLDPAERLLDIGCSAGWVADGARSRGIRSYVGLDTSITGRTASANVEFVVGSALELPFNDQSFDAVCLFDVIEHLPKGSEKGALYEAQRVLRPDGRLYLSTPHASPIHTLLDPAWFFGHRHYRRTTIQFILETTGFKVDRLFVAGGVVECLEYLRLMLYKHLLHRTAPPLGQVAKLIDKSHGRDHLLGMTIFATASRADEAGTKTHR
jgi:SAM-dependent methyltransferase